MGVSKPDDRADETRVGFAQLDKKPMFLSVVKKGDTPTDGQPTLPTQSSGSPELRVLTERAATPRRQQNITPPDGIRSREGEPDFGKPRGGGSGGSDDSGGFDKNGPSREFVTADATPVTIAERPNTISGGGAVNAGEKTVVAAAGEIGGDPTLHAATAIPTKDSNEPASVEVEGMPDDMPTKIIAARDVRLQVGTVLGGRWRLTKKIGEGGMGQVFLAEHTELGHSVCLKLINTSLLDKQGEEARGRFILEAKIGATLKHPNIVKVTDIERDNGTTFINMEYVEGEDLRSFFGIGDSELPEGPNALSSKQMDPRLVLPIFVKICRALHAAHTHKEGVVHRDMKPANVIITKDKEPKICDFGIAKLTKPNDDSQPGLTNAGMALGTPYYMAPELNGDHPIDRRTDMYAVGIMLYEALVGRKPFIGGKSGSAVAIITEHVRDDPPHPQNFGATLPPGVINIITRAIMKDPDDRFLDMTAMAEAIEEEYTQILKGESTPPPGGETVALMQEQILPTRKNRAKMFALFGVAGIGALGVLATAISKIGENTQVATGQSTGQVVIPQSSGQEDKAVQIPAPAPDLAAILKMSPDAGLPDPDSAPEPDMQLEPDSAQPDLIPATNSNTAKADDQVSTPVKQPRHPHRVRTRAKKAQPKPPATPHNYVLPKGDPFSKPPTQRKTPNSEPKPKPATPHNYVAPTGDPFSQLRIRDQRRQIAMVTRKLSRARS